MSMFIWLLFVFCVSLLAPTCVTADAVQYVVPKFKWSQDFNSIMLTFPLRDLNHTIAPRVQVNTTHFFLEANSTDPTKVYRLQFELRESIDGAGVRTHTTRYAIQMKLPKTLPHLFDRLADDPNALKAVLSLDWNPLKAIPDHIDAEDMHIHDPAYTQYHGVGPLEDLHDFVGAHSIYVEQLTNATYNQTLESTDLVLIHAFYPWCRRCEGLRRIYYRVAESYSKRQLNEHIRFTEVDLRENKELSGRFTQTCTGNCGIWFHQDRELWFHEESADTDELDSYVSRFVGHPVTHLNSHVDVQHFLNRNSTEYAISIIGFVKNLSCDSYDMLTRVADDLRDEYKFAAVSEESNPGLMLDYHVRPDTATFLIFSSKEDEVHRFEWSDSHSEIDFKQYIHDHSVPFLQPMSQTAYAEALSKNKLIGRLFLSVRMDNRQLLSSVNSVAEKFRSKFVFFWEYAQDPAMEFFLITYGLDYRYLPAFGIEDMSTDHMKRYGMNQDRGVNFDLLPQFCDEVASGLIQPSNHSESIPRYQPSPLLKLVSNDFYRQVKASDKNVVLVNYYDQFEDSAVENMLERLAERYFDFQGNLTFFKMDLRRNGFHHTDLIYESTGPYPRVLFIEAKHKVPTYYADSIDFDRLNRFVERKMAEVATCLSGLGPCSLSKPENRKLMSGQLPRQAKSSYFYKDEDYDNDRFYDFSRELSEL